LSDASSGTVPSIPMPQIVSAQPGPPAATVMPARAMPPIVEPFITSRDSARGLELLARHDLRQQRGGRGPEDRHPGAGDELEPDHRRHVDRVRQREHAEGALADRHQHIAGQDHRLRLEPVRQQYSEVAIPQHAQVFSDGASHDLPRLPFLLHAGYAAALRAGHRISGRRRMGQWTP